MSESTTGLSKKEIEALNAPFAPADLNFRPGNIYNGAAIALAHITARMAEKRLNEVLPGLCNITFTEVPNAQLQGDALGQMLANQVIKNLYSEYNRIVSPTVKCTITIPSRGITVEDYGQASNGTNDGWKSAASDALKRAAVHLGVGAYLYDLPTVYVKWEGDQYGKWIDDPAAVLFDEKGNVRAQAAAADSKRKGRAPKAAAAPAPTAAAPAPPAADTGEVQSPFEGEEYEAGGVATAAAPAPAPAAAPTAAAPAPAPAAAPAAAAPTPPFAPGAATPAPAPAPTAAAPAPAAGGRGRKDNNSVLQNQKDWLGTVYQAAGQNPPDFSTMDRKSTSELIRQSLVNGGNKIAPSAAQISLLFSLCEEHGYALPNNFAQMSGKESSESIQAIMGASKKAA